MAIERHDESVDLPPRIIPCGCMSFSPSLCLSVSVCVVCRFHFPNIGSSQATRVMIYQIIDTLSTGSRAHAQTLQTDHFPAISPQFAIKFVSHIMDHRHQFRTHFAVCCREAYRTYVRYDTINLSPRRPLLNSPRELDRGDSRG